MKIVITGASGFLGWHVLKAFEPYSFDKHGIVGFGRRYNLTNMAETKCAFEVHKPDVVVHMAAVCGGIKANSQRPADFIQLNTQMALNVVEACRVFGVKRFYSLGSVCAYPKYCPVPFKEDDLWNGYPEETNAPYGMSKRMLLMLGQAYRAQHGLLGAHLIPVNLYGEHDHFDLENSHVIPALINKFTTAVAEKRDTVQCWGTGEATREFLYAGDAAEAIVKAVMSELDYALPINLGTGTDISIKELASTIGQLTGFTGEIEFTGEVSDGQPQRRLDVTRAQTVLGFQAKTSLLDGLVRTIEWYKKQ